MQEALDYFLKAESIQSGFWLKNQLNIAKCYMQIKNVPKAKEWLEQIAAGKLVTAEDRDVAAEAKTLLAKL